MVDKKRSEASKKGWETRRARQKKALIKARRRDEAFFKRSQAAKKGWETRRKKQQAYDRFVEDVHKVVTEGANPYEIAAQRARERAEQMATIENFRLEAIEDIEKLYPDWVESDESNILAMMFEAASAGMTTRVASELAQEYDWEERDIWSLYFQTFSP